MSEAMPGASQRLAEAMLPTLIICETERNSPGL